MDGSPGVRGKGLRMLRAVFFDQDGVIIDTERDGHRVAFNRAFAEFGFPAQWDTGTYQGLLAIGGGKERMTHYLHRVGFGKPVRPEEEAAVIQRLHARKTELFVEMIESGSLPLRPGVRRFMREVAVLGLLIGICTTSNEKAARAILRTQLSDIPVALLLAGDMVKRKKPDPEIYRLALEKTGLQASECLVVEDSQNGVEAASAAGIRVLATVNDYTAGEDLSKAAAVVSCLGDPGGQPARLIRGPFGFADDGVVRVGDCLRLME